MSKNKQDFNDWRVKYIQLVARANGYIEDVDTLMKWLTGYDEKQFLQLIKDDGSVREFFDNAPRFHPKVDALFSKSKTSDSYKFKLQWLNTAIEKLINGRAVSELTFGEIVISEGAIKELDIIKKKTKDALEALASLYGWCNCALKKAKEGTGWHSHLKTKLEAIDAADDAIGKGT